MAADESIPILPPKGIQKELVDSFQQEKFQYCNRIEPRYIPTIEVVNYPYEDTHLIYLKCSAGDAGPCQAPADVYHSKKSDKKTDMDLAIRNIGILMFSDRPDKLIAGAQINLVKFNTPEAEASGDFIEKTFTAPIWKQVRDALAYIESTVIEEKVVKIKNQAEAERYYNYPYNALEEVLINAVFHKSYRDGFELNPKVSDKQKIFYAFLMEAFKSSEYVTTKIMTEYSDLAESTTRRYLNQFCDMQIIKSDGKTKEPSTV